MAEKGVGGLLALKWSIGARGSVRGDGGARRADVSTPLLLTRSSWPRPSDTGWFVGHLYIV